MITYIVRLFRDLVKWYLTYVYAACDLLWLATGGRLTANGISIIGGVQGLATIPLIEIGYYNSALANLAVSLYLDHIDGVWARRYNQVTRWGGYIDRTRDKIVVLALLIYLIVYVPFPFILEENCIRYLLVLSFLSAASLLVSNYQWIGELIGRLSMTPDQSRARWQGKTKMILESALLLIIIAYNTGSKELPRSISDASVANLINYLSLAASLFATVSLFGHLVAPNRKQTPSGI